MVLGVFSNVIKAKNAVLELEKKGFTPSHIPIITKEGEKEKIVVEETGVNDVLETIGYVMMGGAVLGGLLGLLISLDLLSALSFLFIGDPIVRALGLGGTLENVLSGVISGLLIGGILGALISFVNNREHTAQIENSEALGLILVPVRESEENEASLILTNYEADHVRRIDQAETQRELEAETYREEYHTPAFYHDLRSDEDWDKLKNHKS